ncbi:MULTISPECIES: LCP family protein [Paenibacillus]|uniref:LytR family transcriptional attenuator n=1 Tax=Paenibacillus pabuli TaxID=1472 RepID=A0A855YJM5_9BACL|nr:MULTISPECIES: LCP family protein [Paenibacillus]PWW45114.1 LytR family transcriptional attenuator [Paenibacillus pabuli]PXW11450.1 LytR family transcriptional attenuator [Paenibacillus taichungensis]
MLKKWLWGTSLTLALAIAGVIVYYGYSIVHFANSISTASETSTSDTNQNTDTPTTPVPKWEGKERVNILLLGGDTRGEDAGRSDSVMVASIDPVSKKAHLFSVLRDTYVDIPGHGKSRLNAAFSYGGAELTKQTVGDLLGIPIQHYVYTDFIGFMALVDAVDGIDIDVEKDMYYTSKADKNMYDIDLKKGLQHMDGKTALQYVRFRHDATSDFTRTERQRIFMTELAKKMQSTTSLFKIPEILEAVAPYIETDLSPTQMLKLASLGFDINVNEIEKQQIPPNKLLTNELAGSAQVLGVNKPKLQSYIQNLFEEDAKSSEDESTKAQDLN